MARFREAKAKKRHRMEAGKKRQKTRRNEKKREKRENTQRDKHGLTKHFTKHLIRRSNRTKCVQSKASRRGHGWVTDGSTVDERAPGLRPRNKNGTGRDCPANPSDNGRGPLLFSSVLLHCCTLSMHEHKRHCVSFEMETSVLLRRFWRRLLPAFSLCPLFSPTLSLFLPFSRFSLSHPSSFILPLRILQAPEPW
jgi:hypothetical protein